MPVLHVRNVPDDLHARLQRRARENRSLSAEVITLLAHALDEAEQGQAEVLQGIGRRRRFYRPTQHNAPDTTTLLREYRNR